MSGNNVTWASLSKAKRIWIMVAGLILWDIAVTILISKPLSMYFSAAGGFVFGFMLSKTLRK